MLIRDCDFGFDLNFDFGSRSESGELYPLLHLSISSISLNLNYVVCSAVADRPAAATADVVCPDTAAAAAAAVDVAVALISVDSAVDFVGSSLASEAASAVDFGSRCSP